MNLSKQYQKEGNEPSPAESRLLRKHVPAIEDEDADDEERGIEWLTKLLKLDDLPPQKAIEMVNLRKMDDVINAKKFDDVLDVKKLDDVVEPKKLDDAIDLKKLDAKEDDKKMYDDLKFLVDDIVPGLKLKKSSPETIRNDLVEAGVTDKKAIATVLKWFETR
ncbi:uncharacterized protein IUM83_18768 [Phytophthora cinnamomi]|uniref:uncharacterized protein n=1 Tax=Phytophthora cinnamomi TaxID=4785 RepID=UPI00355ABE65|nr:hypothetical protein IUM83_18768 [Phytophthora cinnamomi]